VAQAAVMSSAILVAGPRQYFRPRRHTAADVGLPCRCQRALLKFLTWFPNHLRTFNMLFICGIGIHHFIQ
jgi:hypothetical protein